MEIKQLEYVLAVAKHKNFSKAAAETFVSQPSISQQIKLLEKELQIKIFSRDTHQVSLTDIGKIFCEHAQIVLNDIYELKNAINKYTGTQKPVIRVGVFPFYQGTVLREAMDSFFSSHSEVIWSLEVLESTKAIDGLTHGEYDLLFIRASNPIYIPSFECIELTREPIYAMLPKSFETAVPGEITVEELSKFPLFTTSKGSNVYEQYKKLFEKHNLSFNIAFISDTDFNTYLHLLKLGRGTFIAAESTAKAYCGDHSLPHKIIPGQDVSTYILIPKDHLKFSFYRNLIDHIKTFY